MLMLVPESSQDLSSKGAKRQTEAESGIVSLGPSLINDDANDGNLNLTLKGEFIASVRRKILEVRADSKRKSADITNTYTSIHLSYSSRFLDEKFCDLLKLVPENATSLASFAEAVAKLDPGDGNNNINDINGQPEMFYTPLSARTNVVSFLSSSKPLKTILKSAKRQDIFPAVAEMSGRGVAATPVFHFHGSTSKDTVVQKRKVPRLIKPGETGVSAFSATGSPIMIPHEPKSTAYPNTPGNNATGVDKPVRLQVPDIKGNIIDVDLIYRGNPDEAKHTQAFLGFVTDVRGLISTRATTVGRKRVQPPRNIKAGAKKRKSGWK